MLMFYLSLDYHNCEEKTASLKLFCVLQTNLSFIQLQSLNLERESAIWKSHIALYNTFMHSSLANQKQDILLSI